MDATALQTALDLLGADAAGIAVWSRVVLKSRSERIVRRRMPDDAAAAAQQLFAVLREFDAAGVSLIWVETPLIRPNGRVCATAYNAPRRPDPFRQPCR